MKPLATKSLALALIAAAFTASTGCVSDRPVFADGAVNPRPFSCAGTGLCPTGYRCSSDLCIPNDAPDLPTNPAGSATPFVPFLHLDPDRNGVLTCWSRDEDQQSQTGGIDATFMESNGHVHAPSIRLVTLDTRGSEFQATCAPIPGTNGKILVAAWLQSNATAEMRLFVWSPLDGDPYHGSAVPYYSEFAVNSHLETSLLISRFRAAVVGSEVWVPWVQEVPAPLTSLPPQRVIRFRVGAPELAAGRPNREVLIDGGVPDYRMAVGYFGSQGGAWMQSGGGAFRYLGFSPTTAAVLRPLLQMNPDPSVQAGVIMAAHGLQAAAIWTDPSENCGPLGDYYRLAWLDWTSPRSRLFPFVDARLPATRRDTLIPAGMDVGNDFYLVVASSGDVPNAPLPDGGMDAACSASVQGADAAAARNFQIKLFRAAWPETVGLADGGMRDGDAPDASGSQLVFVKNIDRALGNNPATILAAQPMDSAHFALAWVEFYPPDVVGHGARYVLYLQQIEF